MTNAIEQGAPTATTSLDREKQAKLGQFMTPAPVARLMASMIEAPTEHVRILEPGAGAGSLLLAAVTELCRRERRPRQITVAAYEVDPMLGERLKETLKLCGEACRAAEIVFAGEAIEGDFIERAVELLAGETDLFGGADAPRFDLAITNPPYRKLNSNSTHRKLLRRVDIETSNLYTAFLSLAVKLLSDGGEMVAITPRSFCNGPYFRSFRELLLGLTAVQRIHLFESRNIAFQEDDVLQENVIFRVVRGSRPADVTITVGNGSRESIASERIVHHDQLVRPGDPERFIHIVSDESGQKAADAMRVFRSTLQDLDIAVSTGRVVDFRARSYLRKHPEAGTAPLIYPGHFAEGFVTWPVEGKKPNAIRINDDTRDQLVPSGTYVLVKRFSAKEERRRVVAVVYDPSRISSEAEGVAFENHLNYFHRNGSGLNCQFARGLALFLNSTLLDTFFRQFSGHTQVNATDLRIITYPTEEQLLALGACIGDTFPAQEVIDSIVSDVL